MKPIIITAIASVLTLLASIFFYKLIIRFLVKKQAPSRKTKILTIVLIWIAFFVIGAPVFFAKYMHCGEAALAALDSDNNVTVSKINKAYLFDGYGTEDVLVFYPGARVDEKAYAPLCHRLAENGIDCILVKMPFHMAFTDSKAYLRYASQYDYENMYLGGHSLGGAIAALFAAKYVDKPDSPTGLVLLAAYPSAPLPDIKTCLIYGEKDTVMNMDQYNIGKDYWSNITAEYIIPGGNHAGFGDYGAQKGDSPASISAEEQLDETVNIITDFITNDIHK